MESDQNNDKSSTVLGQDTKSEVIPDSDGQKSTGNPTIQSKIEDNTTKNMKIENVFSTEAITCSPFDDVPRPIAPKSQENAENTDTITPNTSDKGSTAKMKHESQGNESIKNAISDNNTNADKTNVEGNLSKNFQNTDDETNFDDDGEDLPDNFFDDFSNTDFMAGLDIVDDWIDDDEPVNDLISSPQSTQDADPKRNNTKKTIETRTSDKVEKKTTSHHDKHDRSPNRVHRDKPKYDDREYRYKRSRYSKERHSRGRYSRSRYSRDRHSRERISRERYIREKISRDEERYRRNKSWDRGRSREHDRPRVNRRSMERNRSRENERARKSVDPEKRTAHDASNTKPKQPKNENTAKLTDDSVDRRDPEKTRRDIQKDKIRCAKDQEARVFQEQLKVAETGLVPPGTELEVILESEKLKKEEQKELLPPPNKRSASIEHKPRKKSRSTSHHRYSARNVDRPSFERHRDRSRDRNRSFSPKYKRRSTERDVNRDNDDLRFHLREKRRRRYMSDLSPVSEARMSRTPEMSPLSSASNLSDRETWLRNKERLRSRYSRSCSPISSNSLSDGVYSKRKRSKRPPFKEEIERKLQMTAAQVIKPYPPPLFSNIVNRPMDPVPTPVPPPVFPPVPLPVPMPMQMQMQFQPNPNMFIPPEMCPSPYGMQMPMQQTNMCNFNTSQITSQMENILNTNISVVMPQATEQPMTPEKEIEDPNSTRVYSNLKPCYTDESPVLNKLFEDKKISLSDYLSVSAKTLDSTPPVNVHNRIRVIARCQDAIKSLAGDSKLFGRFFPKLIDCEGMEFPAEIEPPKWRSPLRRVLPIRIRFTIPDKNQKNNIELPTRTILYKLLCSLGLENPVKFIIQKPKPDTPAPVSTVTPVQAPPVETSNVLPVQQRPVLIKRTTIHTQTETYKCEKCEIRDEMVYIDEGTQTIDKATFEVSTQVSIEDLTKSCATFTPRGILKNHSASVQSISHLTPAQLLAQLDKPKKEDAVNTWTPARQVPERFIGATTNAANNSPRQLFSSQDNKFSGNMSSNKDHSIGSMGGYKSIFGGNLDNMSYFNTSNSFKSPFSGNAEISPFSPDRSFDRNNSDMSGVQSGEYQNRPNSVQFNNSAGRKKVSRFSEANFNDHDFTPESPFMDSNQNLGNRSVTGRGRGGTPRNFQGSGNNMYQNRPFYN